MSKKTSQIPKQNEGGDSDELLMVRPPDPIIIDTFIGIAGIEHEFF